MVAAIHREHRVNLASGIALDSKLAFELIKEYGAGGFNEVRHLFANARFMMALLLKASFLFFCLILSIVFQ